MTEPQTRPDVIVEVGGTATVPDGRRAYVRLTLEYRASRPLMVTARFSDALTGASVQEDPIRAWELDRETLANGCGGSDMAGLADVKAAAVAGTLLLHLQGNPTSEGIDRCVVRLPLADVSAFLDRTFRLVPLGAEAVWPSLDADLARLIDNHGEV